MGGGNMTFSADADAVRGDMEKLHIADGVDVSMDLNDDPSTSVKNKNNAAASDDDGDGDSEDGSYQDSDQPDSDVDEEEDEQIVDVESAKRDELITALLQDNGRTLHDAAVAGFDVADDGLVIDTVFVFRQLVKLMSHGDSEDKPVVAHAVMSQLAGQSKSKYDDFAWFGKMELVETYLTIATHTDSCREVAAAIAEPTVVDEGKVSLLKLASALKG